MKSVAKPNHLHQKMDDIHIRKFMLSIYSLSFYKALPLFLIKLKKTVAVAGDKMPNLGIFDLFQFSNASRSHN